MTTKTTTRTTTLAALAVSMDLDPKVVRAKFRRLSDEAPFDHTKVKQLTAAQAKAARAFLNTDYRLAAE